MFSLYPCSGLKQFRNYFKRPLYAAFFVKLFLSEFVIYLYIDWEVAMQNLNKSRFNMWRAVVAMVHADGVVTPHELSFIQDHIAHLNLSEGQLRTIGEDLKNAQDVYERFRLISDLEDQRDFFALARALSWCDGDFANQERMIIKHLEKALHDKESRHMLEESRDLVNEIELCDNQWRFKSERSKSLFGFLSKRKAA